jgi:hypothetical protein
MLIFVSCTNDDDVNPMSESSHPILVKKIITKDVINNSIINVTEFEYDGNKISKSSDQNDYTIIYTYTGDLISNIKIYHSNILTIEYLLVYENNNLIESKYISYIENVCEKRLYTYNLNGTVDFIYYKGDLSTQNTFYKSGSIIIQNGEVIEIVVQDFINSNNSRSTTYTYDNNNNPHKNVMGFSKLKVELDRTGGSFKNPILTSSNYNNGMMSTTDFTYTYNSSGYPISSTRISWGVNYKSDFFY